MEAAGFEAVIEISNCPPDSGTPERMLDEALKSIPGGKPAMLTEEAKLVFKKNVE